MNSSTTDQQTQAILNGFYKSVAEKNPETVASFFSDKIDGYLPKSNILPWTGKLVSKSDIVKALTLLFDAHVDGGDQLEVGHLFIDGNEAAAFGKFQDWLKKQVKNFQPHFASGLPSLMVK
ncbi:hypothetical protein FC093_18295 [Ilyomonas limi]|uniref:Nuclear transport factor 2 family protein n=1 Tax=Ilyomonas limi TaxID=2575867 RepID=A0A4U3KTV0_9BACT|nr:hypothetical protein [Ilyomonas limi]TKK65955.1 hypothetical protein FC093_18295 [Ilyomonas limi]